MKKSVKEVCNIGPYATEEGKAQASRVAEARKRVQAKRFLVRQGYDAKWLRDAPTDLLVKMCRDAS